LLLLPLPPLLLLLLLLLQVCAYHEWNLDGLVEMCWEYLDLVSVITCVITYCSHRYVTVRAGATVASRLCFGTCVQSPPHASRFSSGSHTMNAYHTTAPCMPFVYLMYI
jgi:hypothetical protein